MPFFEIFSKTKIKEEIRPKIIIDIREKNSMIAAELKALNCETEFKQLPVGDYIVKNTIIERKTINDFISSMLNKRLINQLNDLQKAKRKLLIIEGIDEYELYHNESNINENAIRGFLLSIVLNYQVPIIYTKDAEDTANFIKVLWKKQEKEKDLGLNINKRPKNVSEQLQFILEGFPGIGPKTAKKLLKEYKTLKNILNAPIEDLQKLIGKKAEIFKLINEGYQK